ncbi:MAG: toll/interleukin-1 receptor domain-containing protein [Planctomycetes bacterium]|nr:toll/interleukin-1 receptor domain-containing protein [Planctomycetota bacterium]
MRLVRDLQRYGIEVWLDRFEIQPGEDWKIAIRKAIEKGMFFIACFSSNYWNRQENLMNEELQIAIEKMQRMQDERIWFIPVKLNPCSISDFEIRSGKFLDSKQWVELFSDCNEGIHRIVSVIKYRQNT